MKKFLIESLIFFFALFLIAAGLDRIISMGLLKMEDYRFQDYCAMLQGGMNHDILIMGSSRGKSHYDPYLIDSLCNVSSFCIGIGGYPINAQIAKYHLYREHNRKPRVIIQNVDHGTLFTMDDVRHQHESEQFFPLIYDTGMREDLKKMGYGFLELNFPLYRYLGYQQVIKNGLLEALSLKHYNSRSAYKGHWPEKGPWDGTELAKIDSIPVEFTEKARVLFEEYLDQCAKDSIRVALVFTPVYIGALNKMRGLEDIKQYYVDQANQRDFVYLDYTDTCSISLDTNNFCVAVHMNQPAAKEFTRMLCDTLAHL